VTDEARHDAGERAADAASAEQGEELEAERDSAAAMDADVPQPPDESVGDEGARPEAV
jgi:hypothetical protein